jgi:SAM-dependent methyltransferase
MTRFFTRTTVFSLANALAMTVAASAPTGAGAQEAAAQSGSHPPAAAVAPQGNAPLTPIVRFEAVNRNEPAGDKLGPARRIGAAIVAQDNPAPKSVIDVGSFTGEFLEAFLEQFPSAHGQWTEPVETNHVNAKRRLGRFGNRVDYVIGCASRDISLGCVPKGVDVLITSWLSIHQDLPGINKFYKEAAAMLPPGGWLANLDHVGYGGSPWERRFEGARKVATGEGLAAITEGPPVHHKDFTVPTLEEQLAAFKAAGFDDVQVVWRRFNTVLLMARKQ